MRNRHSWLTRVAISVAVLQLLVFVGCTQSQRASAPPVTHVTVFLERDASIPQVLRDRVAALPGVSAVDVLSAQEAMDRYRQEVGHGDIAQQPIGPGLGSALSVALSKPDDHAATLAIVDAIRNDRVLGPVSWIATPAGGW
jgi:cell division protein FtsX